MRKNCILTLTLVLMLIFSFSTNVFAKSPLPQSITSDGYVLMDLNTGKVLASKNAETKYEPASITKILTALVTIENSNLDDKVVIGKNPPLEEGSSAYLKEGETFTVEQLLYGLMLVSGNDTATALAEHVSGSIEAFTEKMNEKAKSLGAVNSHFANPHGLPNDNHYVTPMDMAIIAKKAMENPTFRKIVSTSNYEIPSSEVYPYMRFFTNHNKMISSSQFAYDGANGIKTGYTTRAGHTYVGSATRGDTSLVVVCLKNGSRCYEDSKALLDWGFENFEDKLIVTKDKSVGKINEKGKEDISLIPEESFYYTAEKGQAENISTDIKYSDTDNFNAGDVVAVMNISVNGKPVGSVNLKADKPYFSFLGNIKHKVSSSVFLTILAIIAVSIAAILIIYIFIKAKLRRKKEESP